MARSISPNSLATLAQKFGTQPITVLEVGWNPFLPTVLYADKAYPDLGIQGRIISCANFDDALNFDKNKTTSTMTVTVNDTDGHFKSYFDGAPIFGRPVIVWQWFEGIPWSDRFLIFLGNIATPIIWDEGERTFTFDILSKVWDTEVGFSAEQGSFPYIPQSIVGKMWPIIFGTVLKMPCICVDEIPHSSSTTQSGSALKDSFGIHDPQLDNYNKDTGVTSATLASRAVTMFSLYLQAQFTATQVGELGPLDDLDSGSGTFVSLAKQYLSQGNKDLQQSQKMNSDLTTSKKTLTAQKSYEKSSLGITNGRFYPQGQTMTLNIGGAQVTGYFDGDNFNVQSAVHPNSEVSAGMVINPYDSRIGDPVITRNQFFFLNPGNPANFSSQLSASFIADPLIPIRYIVASYIPVTITAVYAYLTVNGWRQLSVVPWEYFYITYEDFGAFTATVLNFYQPLSSIIIDWNDPQSVRWEDNIFVDVISDVGPNTADILIWLIENFSTSSYDLVSFTEVAEQLAFFPMNFALTKHENCTKLIQDIAYQSRCIVYEKNSVFYIKYLAIQDISVDVITENDIIYNSMKIESSILEEIVTKYTAKWRPDYLDITGDAYVIERLNMDYGLMAKDFDYYTYNFQACVEWSAIFWTIRLANTWKKITFKTTLSKLNIETLDTITLNFSHPYIAYVPVAAIVESASVDTANYEITFTCWCPVRVGEMYPYFWAWPAGLPVEQDVFTFNANNSGSGETAKQPSSMPTFTKDSNSPGQSASTGSFGGSDGPTGDSSFSSPVITTAIASTDIAAVGNGQKPLGTTQYQFNKYRVTQPNIVLPSSGTIFPGKITDGTGSNYTVDVYLNGLSSKASSVQGVTQLQISADDSIPSGTWCLVNRIVSTDVNNKSTVAYYIQVPVWLSSS